jgi:hypothetical protein
LLEEGFGPWPKLTGGKGLHLMIPSDRDWSWKAAHEWAKRFATRYAARDDRYTTSASLGQRPGRLFLDYLRIGRGTTAIGAWSPRARPGYPIAMPVSRRMSRRASRPDHYKMGSVRQPTRIVVRRRQMKAPVGEVCPSRRGFLIPDLAAGLSAIISPRFGQRLLAGVAVGSEFTRSHPASGSMVGDRAKPPVEAA